MGLLLCESHRSTIVEYTLQNVDQPIGVSSYRVTRELPAPIRDQVPTVEDLQEVIGKLREQIDVLRRDNEPDALIPPFVQQAAAQISFANPSHYQRQRFASEDCWRTRSLTCARIAHTPNLSKRKV